MTERSEPHTSSAGQPPLASGGWPLLGNALDLTSRPMPFFVAQYREHGPIFRVHAAHQRLLVLAGPEAAIRLRGSGYDEFASGALWQPFLRQLGAESFLLSLNGPPHQARRHLLKPGFSRDYLMPRIPAAVRIVREHLGAVQGREIGVTAFFKRLLVDLLGRLHASHALGPVLDDLIVFHDALIARTTGLRPQWLWRLPGYRARKRRVLQRMHTVIDRHRVAPNEEPDMIDELVRAYDRGETGMSEAELTLAAMGPFVAGKDTAAPTLSFLFNALLENPDVLERCRAEADALFESGPPAPSSINDSAVLSGAVLETLRLYPTAPAFVRTTTRPIDFEGYRIQANQRVIVAATVSHFLSRFYRDAERFDIDRFGPGRREHRQRGAFAPYGLGPHICLGAALSEAVIKTILATVLHDFDVQLADPHYRMRADSIPNPAPNAAFKIRLRRRT
ncbi:MAG: cytochrome P450 [Myxococcota bacterium]